MDTWQQALKELKPQMTEATFNSLLLDTHLLNVEGNVYTIEAKNSMVVDSLEKRQKAVIARTLSNIVGKPVQLEFVPRKSELLDPEPLPQGTVTTAIVMQVGQLHFEGNIIPASWFEHLKYKTGKPHINAIVILSEIVYWYRPVEIRNEGTGQVTGHRKKFKADKLQRSYKSFSTQFGFTKKQVQDAIQFLTDERIITKELRDMPAEDGTPLSNVLFLEIVPDRLKEITYSRIRKDDYTL